MTDIVIHDSEALGGKLKKKSKQLVEKEVFETSKSNVVYVGRIPHGFYEKEMKEFFGQFGTIINLRVSRNKQTGKSKHYGFIQFELPEVAAIVVESMNNYLLFESMLQVKLVPLDKLHPKIWVGANRKFKVLKFQEMKRKQHNKIRSPGEQKRHMKGLIKKDKQRRAKLKAAGIEFNFPDIRDLVPSKPKTIKSAEDLVPSKPEKIKLVEDLVPSGSKKIKSAEALVPSKPKKIKLVEDLVPSESKKIKSAEALVPSKPKKIKLVEDLVPSESKKIKSAEALVPSKPKKIKLVEDLVPSKPKKIKLVEDLVPSKPKKIKLAEDVVPSRPKKVRLAKELVPSTPKKIKLVEDLVRSKPKKIRLAEDLVPSKRKKIKVVKDE